MTIHYHRHHVHHRSTRFSNPLYWLLGLFMVEIMWWILVGLGILAVAAVLGFSSLLGLTATLALRTWAAHRRKG